MKKIIISIVFVMLSIANMYAQNASTYTEAFDNVFRNISRQNATTGILYERVIPFAQLQKYNSNIANVDTGNLEHFKQAYFEFFNATFKQPNSFPFNSDMLESLIKDNNDTADIICYFLDTTTIDSMVK